MSEALPRSLANGVKKYMEFHSLEPKDVIYSSASIPEEGTLLGPAEWITYRSGKWGKGTYDYIHKHHAGVKIVCFDKSTIKELGCDGNRSVRVPRRHRDVDTLVRLGHSLGFAFRDGDGEEMEAKTTPPRPNLYCTTSGRCLYILEKRGKPLCAIWGGKLGVEARGIVY